MDRDFNLLYPLDTFYARSGTALPTVEETPGEEVPEPYHRLLVGAHDMTPTLERFHGERITLEVLERLATEEDLARLVVLHLRESGRPVEFGAIIIHLKHFPEEARQAVLDCRMPLGTLLATFGLRHESCPQAFVRVQADETMQRTLGLTGGPFLYGRRNVLLTEGGGVLADILELLPPEGTA